MTSIPPFREQGLAVQMAIISESGSRLPLIRTALCVCCLCTPWTCVVFLSISAFHKTERGMFFPLSQRIPQSQPWPRITSRGRHPTKVRTSLAERGDVDLHPRLCKRSRLAMAITSKRDLASAMQRGFDRNELRHTEERTTQAENFHQNTPNLQRDLDLPRLPGWSRELAGVDTAST